MAGAGEAHAPPALRHYELRVDAMLQSKYLIPARDRLGARRWDELAARGARLGREDAIELGLDAAAEPHEARHRRRPSEVALAPGEGVEVGVLAMSAW